MVTNLGVFGGGLLMAILALVAFFYKSKAVNEGAKALEASTQITDAPLAAQQANDESKIKEVDAGIQAMKDEREKLRNQYLTDQQRAESWNKPKQ